MVILKRLLTKSQIKKVTKSQIKKVHKMMSYRKNHLEIDTVKKKVTQ